METRENKRGESFLGSFFFLFFCCFLLPPSLLLFSLRVLVIFFLWLAFFPSGRCREYSQVIDVVCFHSLSFVHILYRSRSWHSLRFCSLNLSSFCSPFLSFPPIPPFFGIFISLLKFRPLSLKFSRTLRFFSCSHILFSQPRCRLLSSRPTSILPSSVP